MTNLIGIHALCWVGGWSPEEARRPIASSKEAGYDLIQLAALEPESVRRRPDGEASPGARHPGRRLARPLRGDRHLQRGPRLRRAGADCWTPR